MDNLVLYRVDEQVEDGWKLGMTVWMKSEHFRSFLATCKPTERVRRERFLHRLPLYGKKHNVWTGTVLSVL